MHAHGHGLLRRSGSQRRVNGEDQLVSVLRQGEFADLRRVGQANLAAAVPRAHPVDFAGVMGGDDEIDADILIRNPPFLRSQVQQGGGSDEDGGRNPQRAGEVVSFAVVRRNHIIAGLGGHAGDGDIPKPGGEVKQSGFFGAVACGAKIAKSSARLGRRRGQGQRHRLVDAAARAGLRRKRHDSKVENDGDRGRKASLVAGDFGG